MRPPRVTLRPGGNSFISRRFGAVIRLFCGTRLRARWDGFSLVEITMAIGIVSFAFVSVLGLLPAGLNTFRKAMDTSVTSQIFQRVVSDVQQTDFSVLTSDSNVTVQKSNVIYFDDQGNKLGEKITISNADKLKAIYHVKIRVQVATSLPGTQTQSADLATVTIQIANNPGNLILAAGDSSDIFYDLWSVNQGMPIITQSTMVSRNTSLK